ncbi:hypothetical protein Pelo_13362 [Pelomyxa schiedti]|nr:hypothetical protein Pelo_13362 [Pelomyxa schiedti]
MDLPAQLRIGTPDRQTACVYQNITGSPQHCIHHILSAFTALVVEFLAEMRGCHQVTSLGRTSTDTHSPSLLSTTVIPKQTLAL